MKRARSNSIDRLRGPILRSVSRSFYLSIRLLPAQLRDPIALAYLLARATDTLADTAEVSATLRDESLRKLARAIQGEPSEDEVSSLRNSFAPLQKNAAERTLIEALPSCLNWLEQLQENDRDDIRVVLEHINRGQLLDVRRFGEATKTHALATESDLDEYTYLVAGCVGEFWTQLCFRHLKNFSNQSAERMRSLGREYGKGLQLINILRDAGSDLANGRCYFPEEELKACGVAPNEMISRRAEVAPILEKWRQKAEQGNRRGNGLLLRDPTSPRSFCHGVAGVNRRANAGAVTRSWCGRAAEKNKSSAQRSARHHVVDHYDPGFAARAAKMFERLSRSSCSGGLRPSHFFRIDSATVTDRRYN